MASGISSEDSADDLAPRIKALRQKQTRLFQAGTEARDNAEQGQAAAASPTVDTPIRGHALRALRLLFNEPVRFGAI